MGPKIHCRYCPLTCSSDDKYRQHETSRHDYRQFSPGDTSRHAVSVRSSVERVERTFPSRSLTVNTHPSKSTSPRQSKATIQQITALLDEQMPDFAELLNEPRTSSPMKRLRDEMTAHVLSPSLLIPSDILFSKYVEPVSPEPFKDPMTYSPLDQSFISQPETPIPSACTHTYPPASPESQTPTDTPLDLTNTITPVMIQIRHGRVYSKHAIV
ncbi:unnamed protein product [Mytilus coruscus]|uniref:Uncharacterized protein n=1 Tax=Mytilus coruscus TaxID=42192 RepID=A0A6J8BVJ7_MYTCO|nr:unnamed protein product [Mytilus coruscus]